MTATPSKSFASQLGIDSADPVTKRFEFVECTLAAEPVIIGSQGILGTRSRASDRQRVAQIPVNGQIVLNPSPTELDLLLPWILGGTTSGGVTQLADTLLDRYVTVDKVQKVYTYAGVVVSRATLSGSPGQALTLTLDVEGKTETEANAGTFPSLAIPTDDFFVFSDLTVTLSGSSVPVSAFTLTIDNLVDANRYMNSTARDQLPALDREVTLAISPPYTDDTKGIWTSVKAGTQLTGSFAFTDGSVTYTVTSGKYAALRPRGPEVRQRGSELLLPLTFNLLNDGTTREVKFTKT